MAEGSGQNTNEKTSDKTQDQVSKLDLVALEQWAF